MDDLELFLVSVTMLPKHPNWYLYFWDVHSINSYPFIQPLEANDNSPKELA